MKILAIDTTSPAGSVALLEDCELLGVIASSETAPYSFRLPREVEQLLQAANSALPQVDLYAVASGPGSFTGVRVGLAAVKAWAEVYGKPVVGVSALAALAAQGQGGAPLVAGVSDAHRGQFFAGLYDCSGQPPRPRGEDVVLSPAECFSYLAEQAAGAAFLIRTTILDAVQAALRESPQLGVRVEAADPVLAPAIGCLGRALAERGEFTDALSLDAHYVRRPDAELLWKPR